MWYNETDRSELKHCSLVTDELECYNIMILVEVRRHEIKTTTSSE